jgi:MFS family permease
VSIVILGWAFVTFLQPFSGPSAAQLQIVTPPHLRGRVSAIYVMVFNLMGMCLGPPVVAFVTDFIFGRPEDVNLSLAVSYFAFAVLSAGAFIIGLGPSRKLMAQTVASK